MEDIDWRLANKLIAASGWLNRAMALYKEVPGYDLMSSRGNEAMAELSLALRDANHLMQEKVGKDGNSTTK
jgi:hypothetical protein